jgi:transcriptional regulator with XRE-family HTH domain
VEKVKSLKQWRKIKGMTQRELANQLGLSSPSTISMWENGERKPDLESAKKLAIFFGTIVENIFFGNFDHVMRSKEHAGDTCKADNTKIAG